MTENQNPFGEAGFDMNALLQQAQQMQEQLMSRAAGARGDHRRRHRRRRAGHRHGQRHRRAASACRSASDSFDPEPTTEDLGDLIVAAYRDAKAKADALAAERARPARGRAAAVSAAAATPLRRPPARALGRSCTKASSRT